jgi:hypothetical protein
MDPSVSGYNPMMGFCEHGNEPSVSVKKWGISLLAERLLAFREGPRYTELFDGLIN